MKWNPYEQTELKHKNDNIYTSFNRNGVNTCSNTIEWQNIHMWAGNKSPREIRSYLLKREWLTQENGIKVSYRRRRMTIKNNMFGMSSSFSELSSSVKEGSRPSKGWCTSGMENMYKIHHYYACDIMHYYTHNLMLHWHGLTCQCAPHGLQLVRYLAVTKQFLGGFRSGGMVNVCNYDCNMNYISMVFGNTIIAGDSGNSHSLIQGE